MNHREVVDGLGNVLSFKVAIIGAGWYGCHIGASLDGLGFDVTIFESERRTLHCASGNNQFRLHMGFHYARHHRTRQQSRDGFLRFIERYPNLSRQIDQNIYAVPTEDSLIDFETYKLIMASSGIDFVEMLQPGYAFDNISGAILTRERVLLITQARQHFEYRLEGNLRLNTPVEQLVTSDRHVEIDGVKYDYVIDATWGHFSCIPRNIFFEPTILLYYEVQGEHPALTLVDGPLCSVYPTEDPSIFTLSSVEHTPLGRYATSGEAKAALTRVDGELIQAKRVAMEEQICRYLPNFSDSFRFSGVQLAIKTKPIGKEDDRSCSIYRQGRLFSVMSGKIDTIFYAAERILSLMEEGNAREPVRPSYAIRDEIVVKVPAGVTR